MKKPKQTKTEHIYICVASQHHLTSRIPFSILTVYSTRDENAINEWK